MANESFETTATKYGLSPERLEKVSKELYGILAAYEPKEIQAIVELIERGIPQQSRCKGAGR